MKKSRESNDIVAFVEADERFHKLLFQPVNNELLKKLLGIFWTLLENAKDFSKLADPNLQAGYKKHKAIYQALAEKDHDKLYKLLEKHYEVSKKNIAANQLKVGV
jgi:DNA-binding FadR family transcriptional regulator